MSTYVICVGILYSGNLGAIARLCSNFGVEKLILVKNLNAKLIKKHMIELLMGNII